MSVYFENVIFILIVDVLEYLFWSVDSAEILLNSVEVAGMEITNFRGILTGKSEQWHQILSKKLCRSIDLHSPSKG